MSLCVCESGGGGGGGAEGEKQQSPLKIKQPRVVGGEPVPLCPARLGGPRRVLVWAAGFAVPLP